MTGETFSEKVKWLVSMLIAGTIAIGVLLLLNNARNIGDTMSRFDAVIELCVIPFLALIPLVIIQDVLNYLFPEKS